MSAPILRIWQVSRQGSKHINFKISTSDHNPYLRSLEIAADEPSSTLLAPQNRKSFRIPTRDAMVQSQDSHDAV